MYEEQGPGVSVWCLCSAAVWGVYLLFLCDVGSVGGIHADRNTWRDRCTGQEVRILVISVLDVHRQNSRCVELLHSVRFLFHIIIQNKTSGQRSFSFCNKIRFTFIDHLWVNLVVAAAHWRSLNWQSGDYKLRSRQFTCRMSALCPTRWTNCCSWTERLLLICRPVLYRDLVVRGIWF